MGACLISPCHALRLVTPSSSSSTMPKNCHLCCIDVKFPHDAVPMKEISHWECPERRHCRHHCLIKAATLSGRDVQMSGLASAVRPAIAGVAQSNSSSVINFPGAGRRRP
ncbi:hypothetical protein GY45DRAFT_634085 [Cubamyces sp. BRFM 1775]|nr:hypothetical protein GY45DRAFT_634085 [Cubamyces sp. BRFM 1775]